MTDSVSDLHSGYIFIHEVFASQMKRVRKMVDFLIGKKCLVSFVFYYRCRPVQTPVFIGYGVFESVLVEQFLYELDGVVLKFVKIPNFVMLGKVADL